MPGRGPGRSIRNSAAAPAHEQYRQAAAPGASARPRYRPPSRPASRRVRLPTFRFSGVAHAQLRVDVLGVGGCLWLPQGVGGCRRCRHGCRQVHHKIHAAVVAPRSCASLGYEQAERRRNPSRPVAHTHAGLGRRRHAVSVFLTTSGSFRGVWVTITVTRTHPAKGRPSVGEELIDGGSGRIQRRRAYAPAGRS